MTHWLMKSEPGAFGIEDLAQAPRGRSAWDGVRNYLARNYLRAMHPGDEAFFYHSSCAEPGIAGIMRIVSEAYPDPTQFMPNDPHYDPKSPRKAPRWSAVDVEFRERFTPSLPLKFLREEKRLAKLVILQRGNRLSVTPVTTSQWRRICELARASAKNNFAKTIQKIKKTSILHVTRSHMENSLMATRKTGTRKKTATRRKKTAAKKKTAARSQAARRKVVAKKRAATRKKTGTRKKKAGTRKKKAGTRKKKAGTRKKKAGTRKKKAGTRKKKAGTRKKKAGTRKKKAGTRKKKAGTRKKKAGTRKKKAGARKKKAGTRKKKAGARRKKTASRR